MIPAAITLTVGVVAITGAAIAIAANMAVKALDDSADDEAHGYGGDWPHVPAAFSDLTITDLPTRRPFDTEAGL